MKVLIVDEMHPSIVQMPEELGLEVDYFPNIGLEQVKELVANYEGLIIRSKFLIDQAFLERATQLKFIGRAGAGLDLIDLKACEKLNIAVFGANEANKVTVAEHVIGMLLMLLNNLYTANFEVKNNIWQREKNRGEELFGKKVGIIGFGNNGSATAERLAAFGCKIMAYDRYKYGFGNHQVEECSMEKIFKEAEIVSLHIPLSDETNKMVNAAFFRSFQNPIYFCNASRGEIVVLKDLLEALKAKKVKGACLDVLENEKIDQLSKEQSEAFNYLQNAENVILAPHIAGWSNESYIKINNVLKDKIKRFLKNE